MRKFSKMLAFALAAAMVFTAFAPAAKADAAEKAMAINKQGKILYLTDGEGINDDAQVGEVGDNKGNVSQYDFAVSNKPDDWKAQGYTFTWFSSNTDVITVGKAGLATAKAVGTADVMCLVMKNGEVVGDVLRNTITVKANADVVEISKVKVGDEEVAKEDLDTPLAVGTVVDLDRTMYDADGNKTTKRGTFVTDYTRWVAKDADGEVVGEDVVKITQKNGKFEFLAPGEYTLYCETYQSSKYDDTTATSDEIVVTIAEFKPEIAEIEQTEVKKFTIKFDKATSAAAVTVKKFTTRGDVTVANNAYVKGVEFAKDGMSAVVEMYAELQHNTEYEVTVAGMTPMKFTASKGTPVEMVIYVDAKQMKSDFEEVYFNDGTITINHALFDEKGVNVTGIYAGATVTYSVEVPDPEGKYYAYPLNSTTGSLWFSKEDLNANVLAKYTVYVNNQPLELAAEKVFYSLKKEAPQIVDVADWKIAGTKDDWSDAVKQVPFGKPATLEVKFNMTEGNPVKSSTMNTVFYEALTPNVAALSGNTVIFFQKNVPAQFAVYNKVLIGTNYEDLLIGEVSVMATNEVALGDLALDNYNFIIGAVDDLDEKTVTATFWSNYTGQKYTEKAVALSVEGVDDNGKKAASKVIVNGDKLNFYGYDMLNTLATVDAEGKTVLPASANFTFRVKATTDGVNFISKDVVVTVKNKVAESNYVSVVVGGDFGKDVARTVDSKDAKVGTFTICNMSNGIQTGVINTVLPYEAGKTVVTADAYYFTLYKDGKDITKDFTCVNGVITVNFSGLKDNVVTYDLGAGNYVCTLYKGVALGNSGQALAVQQAYDSGSVTYTPGSYSAAVQKAETVDGTAKEQLLAAFEIKDTKGNVVKTVERVNAITTATDYVFITSFVFRDTVTGADGVTAYAEYTVPVGYAVPIKKAAN